MGKIPGVDHSAPVRALQKAGFRIIRQGRHTVMDGVRFVTIPRHNPVNAYTMALPSRVLPFHGLKPMAIHSAPAGRGPLLP
ncbi:MAG: type II toxin-antitoxin system HicA family toxin [Thermodesulfobacteriota bacterium]